MPTRRASYVPRRGDIIRLDFDPSAGHEQQGTRPALVLSPEAFNAFGMALACPVTRGGAFARGHAWTVPLVGAGLTSDSVVLCNQVVGPAKFTLPRLGRTLSTESRWSSPSGAVGEGLGPPDELERG